MVTDVLSGPVLPATLLLGCMICWSVLAMLGAADLDMPGADIDLDADLDVDVGVGGATDGLSALCLRWANLKEVPIIIWLGTFSVIWWFISASLWSLMDSLWFDPPGWLWASLLVVKNIAISVPITKLATSPMKRWFASEKLAANSLIGKECQISSLQATPEFGQVKYKTEGAPLLLSVRTDGSHLAKGTTVWITHYDEKSRTYIVSATTTDAPTDDVTS